MNYHSQKDYASHNRIIGEVYATQAERLMYILYNIQENKHYFCLHLLDSDNATVEYVIPTDFDELERLKRRKISITRFVRIAHAEDRLFKHIFRLDINENDDRADYEIMKERKIFLHTLPPENTKFRAIELYTE